jgi:hypothetical protein
MALAIGTGNVQGVAGFYLPASREGSHFIIRKLAFHGKELALICQQIATPVHQVLQSGKGAAADLGKGFRGAAIFRPTVNHLNII